MKRISLPRYAWRLGDHIIQNPRQPAWYRLRFHIDVPYLWDLPYQCFRHFISFYLYNYKLKIEAFRYLLKRRSVKVRTISLLRSRYCKDIFIFLYVRTLVSEMGEKLRSGSINFPAVLAALMASY